MLDKLLSNEGKVLYFAVLLILLFVLVWYMYKSFKAENLEGNQVYTSGADQRFAQEFTSANMGSSDAEYNIFNKDWRDYKKPDNYKNAYSEHFDVYRDPYGRKKN